MVDDGEGADGVTNIGNSAGVDVIAGHETNNIKVKGKLFVDIGIIVAESKISNTRRATLMKPFSNYNWIQL